MRMPRKFWVALMGFSVGTLSIGVNAAQIPQEVADQISSLIAASPDGINPGLYSLAGNNPDYAGDIACSVIQYYGQASTVAGVLFELTDLLEGELYGGYMRQNPDAPALLAISGPAFGASLEWSPSELTMVRLNVERSIQDSFVMVTSPGYFSDRVRLSVSHKLRQNIDVTAYGEIGQDKYTGIDRTDHRYGGGVSVGYNLNRHFTAKLAYSYESRNADYLFIQDYSRNRVAVALEARY